MSRNQRRQTSASEITAILDIGTAKVACAIFGVRRGETPQLLGIGHQRSRGVKAGVITDIEAAESAVRSVVSQAERMAGATLGSIVLAVSCGRLKSQSFAASARLDDGVVSDSDIGRVVSAGRAYAERDGRTIVHLNCLGYNLDGMPGIADPRGLAGRELAAELHAVTADEAPLRHHLQVAERCYLEVEDSIPAPYASALAASTEDERRHGTIAIDMGAGTTSMSYFIDGHLAGVDSIAVGGNHVSYDISRELGTSLDEAERIKTLYGSLVSARSDVNETIPYQGIDGGEDVPGQTSRAGLRGVITPRIQSIFGLVIERIAAWPVPQRAIERAVITGGASQLIGLDDFAANVLGRPVRVARPHPVGAMPQSMCSGAFSVVIGALQAVTDPALANRRLMTAPDLTPNYLGRFGQWIRESF
jgi:cell division protein FtsA